MDEKDKRREEMLSALDNYRAQIADGEVDAFVLVSFNHDHVAGMDMNMSIGMLATAILILQNKAIGYMNDATTAMSAELTPARWMQ